MARIVQKNLKYFYASGFHEFEKFLHFFLNISAKLPITKLMAKGFPIVHQQDRVNATEIISN